MMLARALAFLGVVLAMEYVVKSNGADKPHGGGSRWRSEGLILEDADVNKHMSDQDQFMAEMEAYAGHDPIEMLAMLEDESMQKIVDHNKKVVQMLAVVIVVSFFGCLVNVLCMVNNKNYWPTQRSLRRMARRFLSLWGYGHLLQHQKTPASQQAPVKGSIFTADAEHPRWEETGSEEPGSEEPLAEVPSDPTQSS